MPGVLYHLYFGKVVLDSARVAGSLKLANTSNFMAGNIIPNMARNKNDAHYYHQKDALSFYSPDESLVKKALMNIKDESLRFGIKAHLYLDKRFNAEYLRRHFEVDTVTGKIRSLTTKYAWTFEQFYSPTMLYRGYGECGVLILRDGLIDLNWIESNVPKELPKTGIAAMDTRTETPWYREIARVIRENPNYTGSILVYGELVDYIQECATDFALRDYALD